MNPTINNLMTALNGVGEAFCGHAATVFIQSALLVVVLYAVDLLLRKRIRAVFRYCVWLLVLVKLVLPPTLSLPTGVGYWAGDHLPSNVSVSGRYFDMPELEFAGEPPERSHVGPSEGTAEAGPPVAATNAPLPELTWKATLFILWVMGVLAFLALLVQRARFVKGLIAASTQANAEFAGVLEECRRLIGVRSNTSLRISDAIPSPAVCGFFRPTIVIPAALVDKLSPEGLRAILIHELAHIKRGDLWVNSIQMVLQVVYFYSPFVWFANSVIRKVCEEAVDETVLVTLGGRAKDYSNTLIDIGEMAFWRADLGLRLIGVAESRKALQWRIRHMLTRPTPKSSKLGALGIAVLLVIAAVLLPMARAEKSPEESKSVAAENEGKAAESLREAAAAGDIEQVKLFILKGTDVNAVDNKGRTALHFAAQHGHENVTELLLGKGARVNAKDKLGNTALHLAALDGHAKVAGMLVDHSADVNAENKRKVTALHYATKYDFWEMVKLLVAAGADANVKDDTDTTPVYEAMTSAEPGGKEVVEILLEAGARLPAIHIAAYRGDLDKVRSCLGEGADVYTRDEHGGTPLHAAANSGEKDVVSFLIGKGADLRAKDRFGDTPLHFAAMHGYEDVAKLLLARGVDVNAKGQYDYAPLHWAATRGYKRLSELLVAKGANVKARSKNLETPLHCAAWMNRNEVARLLISRGADVNAKERDSWTPLHWAANKGYQAIAELLIANGADINAKRYDGGMPLHLAASQGRKNTVKLLVAKGADVNAKDNEDRTPLWWAKSRGHKETAELLRKHRARE